MYITLLTLTTAPQLTSPWRLFNIRSSGKDKGGPSKGGFLNNIWFSHTVLYLFNEINGVFKHTIIFMQLAYCSGNHLYWDHLCLAPRSGLSLCSFTAIVAVRWCLFKAAAEQNGDTPFWDLPLMVLPLKPCAPCCSAATLRLVCANQYGYRPFRWKLSLAAPQGNHAMFNTVTRFN